MKIEKISWTSDGSKVRLSMPLSKVDKENRIVSGFASLDNADSHDDVVLADASARAFQRFRGNIREMHQPIAVGRMIDFKEEEFYDSISGQFHRGIYVDVHVSKGAEDTWQKVLDGTLTGFSIGGAIIDADTQFVKDAGKNIRFIKEYELDELSLVDNPANQLANVLSIQKNSDGSTTATGMLIDTKSESVFYCHEDGIAKTSSDETYDCPQCGKSMEVAGWIEYENDEEKVSKVGDTLKKFLSDSEEENEGGVTMKIRKNKTEEQSVEETPVEDSVAEVEEEDAVVEEESEEDESVDEVTSDVDEIAEMLDTLKADLEQGFATNISKVAEDLSAIHEKFEKFTGDVEERFKSLDKKHGELTEKFAGLKSELDSVEKSVSKINKSTARRKSEPLGGGSEETVVKSQDKGDDIWRGTFLGTDYLND